MKGIIYDERFTEQRLIEQELREYSQNKDTSRERDTREISTAPNTTPRATQSLIQELRDLEQQLHRHIEYKQRYYEKLYQSTSKDPREPKEQLPRVRDSQQEIQGNYTGEFTRDKETSSQQFNREPSQENLDTNSNFYRGSSNHGIIDIALSQYYNATNQRPIRAFIQNEKIKTENRGIRARKQSIQGILPTAQERELRESNAERTLKQATERFNQRNRELAERQERVINQAIESYSRISNAKQRLLEIRGRNLELERELRNAIANTQYATKEISIIRNDRESRITASDTNLRTERNHAQKRFTDNVRTDFTTRITEYSNQRARDFTRSIQDTTDTIRELRNNSQTRARTILHGIYTRTRDTINAIKDIYRNAKERIRDFFQRADEPLSKRMEQETRELYARNTAGWKD